MAFRAPYPRLEALNFGVESLVVADETADPSIFDTKTTRILFAQQVTIELVQKKFILISKHWQHVLRR